MADFIEVNKPLLGICLGSQLIAHVLGSPVYRNEHTEIGWFPIHFTKEASSGFFPGVDPSMAVMHWHGVAFDLPYGASLLASSEATKVQAYIHENHILGFLCHLEMGPHEFKAMLNHASHDLDQQGPHVQTNEQILSAVETACAQKRLTLFKILDFLFAA